MNKKPFVIAIVGPTAIGKSDYAVKLAKKVGGEIISADSRQVYRGLNIGSGKITKKEMSGIPHYMLNVANPKKVFSAHDYKKMAEKIISDILKRKKTPIIVGGTGFYIDTLLGNISLPEVPPNRKLRKELEKETTENLFKKLKKLDSVRSKTIDKNNKVRLIRAIEIVESLGKVPEVKFDSPYEVLWVGINTDRENLRKRIEKRLKARLMQGMIKEIDELHMKGLSWKRMNELGLEYKYSAMLLQGKISEADYFKTLSDKIYQYAMRQCRWFKRNKKISWMEVR